MDYKDYYRADDNRLADVGACYLMMLNGNPMNPAVAKAQLYVAIHVKK